MRRRSRCSMTVMRSGCWGSCGGAAPMARRRRIWLPRCSRRRSAAAAGIDLRTRLRMRGCWRSRPTSSTRRCDPANAERRARTRLAMRPVEVTDDDVARIDALAEVSVVVELLQDLPTDQRSAVLARIVDDGEYAEIAVTQGVSEAVVRQRVSRGLAGLRRQWEKRI